MTRMTLNGKQARRTGAVVASMAALGMVMVPGIAWASNPIAEGSPVAVQAVDGTRSTAPSASLELSCASIATISDDELQKLIDDGTVIQALPSQALPDGLQIIEALPEQGDESVEWQGTLPENLNVEGFQTAQAVPSDSDAGVCAVVG
ncbi:hypothetical protein ABH922_004430 [Rhodococcus sp. 27YEA15]|uniref:light harvesting protein subunit alpha n=1 Tax=Rhodococcus sp. 27YEA15 TaxID=3156259 RepID=UPI003C7C8784